MSVRRRNQQHGDFSLKHNRLIGGKTSIFPVTTPNSSTVQKEPVNDEASASCGQIRQPPGQGLLACPWPAGRWWCAPHPPFQRTDLLGTLRGWVGATCVCFVCTRGWQSQPSCRPAVPARLFVIGSGVNTLDFGPATRALPCHATTTHRPQTGQRLTDMAIMHHHATLGPTGQDVDRLAFPSRAQEPL